MNNLYGTGKSEVAMQTAEEMGMDVVVHRIPSRGWGMATLIRRFDGTAVVIYRENFKVHRYEFMTVEGAEEWAKEYDIAINMGFGKGARMLGNKLACDFETRDDSERWAIEKNATD